MTKTSKTQDPKSEDKPGTALASSGPAPRIRRVLGPENNVNVNVGKD